jgi:hypothetical protein
LRECNLKKIPDIIKTTDMLLSQEGEEFAKLVLKHFGTSKKPNIPVEQPFKPKPTVVERNPELPQTNKEKYSLDYSKW